LLTERKRQRLDESEKQSNNNRDPEEIRGFSDSSYFFGCPLSLSEYFSPRRQREKMEAPSIEQARAGYSAWPAKCQSYSLKLLAGEVRPSTPRGALPQKAEPARNLRYAPAELLNFSTGGSAGGNLFPPQSHDVKR